MLTRRVRQGSQGAQKGGTSYCTAFLCSLRSLPHSSSEHVCGEYNDDRTVRAVLPTIGGDICGINSMDWGIWELIISE